jgi:hypothetical protein
VLRVGAGIDPTRLFMCCVVIGSGGCLLVEEYGLEEAGNSSVGCTACHSVASPLRRGGNDRLAVGFGGIILDGHWHGFVKYSNIVLMYGLICCDFFLQVP